MRLGYVYNPEKKEEQHHTQEEQHHELRHMKLPGNQAPPEPIVQSEAHGHQWSIHSIRRKAAEGPRICKKYASIGEAPNVEIGFDDVVVVEMKRVVKRVRVGADQENQGQKTGPRKYPGVARALCRLEPGRVQHRGWLALLSTRHARFLPGSCSTSRTIACRMS